MHASHLPFWREKGTISDTDNFITYGIMILSKINKNITYEVTADTVFYLQQYCHQKRWWNLA